ncbi:MAG TPA: DUF427 domain-containing protein [Acidimicrobiales bacterium]|nr:DUF427 domain-containing protein [Acidimicrobiales bacterium]
MSLTTGRGPLSPHPAGRLCRDGDGSPAYVEPYPRRVRGVKDGVVVVDSQRVLLVHRRGAPPAYALAAEDAGGLGDPEPLADGYVHVRWDDLDAWYEEDEQVLAHPRNPYHRVDCVRASRRLRVEVAGTLVVDADDTVVVYETSLAPRLYVARRHLLADVLTESGTTTYCPYKGTATYWSALVDGIEVPDVAFSYEDPYPACAAIAGLLSFEPAVARVDHDLPEDAEWSSTGTAADWPVPAE